MLIQKVLEFAGKCTGTIEAIKKETKDFVGDEDIKDENDNIVKFEDIKFSATEVKDYEVNVIVKKAIEEVKEEVKEVNRIETKAVECKTVDIEGYSGKLYGFEKPEDALKAGMHMKAYLFGDAQAKQWCSDYNVKTQLVGTDSAGGYLTSEELSSAVEVQLREYGVARKLINAIKMGELVFNFNKLTTGLIAYIVAEDSATTASSFILGQESMTCKEMSVLAGVSNLLDVNAIISTMSILSTEAARGFAKKEDDIILTGDGSAGDAGVTGVVPALLAASATACVTAAGVGYDWGDITQQDFINMIALVPTEYRAGSGWIMSRVFKALAVDRLLYALQGNSMPDVEAGSNGTFMDYPIYLSETMPSSFVDEAVACVYGNLNYACKIGDRTNGISVVKSASHDGMFAKRQEAYRFDRMTAYSVYGVRTDGPVAGLVVNSTS